MHLIHIALGIKIMKTQKVEVRMGIPEEIYELVSISNKVCDQHTNSEKIASICNDH